MMETEGSTGIKQTTVFYGAVEYTVSAKMQEHFGLSGIRSGYGDFLENTGVLVYDWKRLPVKMQTRFPFFPRMLECGHGCAGAWITNAGG